jgi:hypothetical protein
MIGRFVYMAGPPEGHIVLDLSYGARTAEARVYSPDHVAHLFQQHQIGMRYEDELMSLPIALSYAVLLAGLSDTALVVSGDRSAWPQEWGELLDMRPAALVGAKSH